MTFRKETFESFIKSNGVGTQRKAAELMGLDESMVSLFLSGARPFLPRHAISVEECSEGLFRADALLPDVTFIRADGKIVGHVEARAA